MRSSKRWPDIRRSLRTVATRWGSPLREKEREREREKEKEKDKERKREERASKGHRGSFGTKNLLLKCRVEGGIVEASSPLEREGLGLRA